MANFKYIPTFESFTNSSKLNEGFWGPIIDGFEDLLDTGIGVEKAYDQMKKSGLLNFNPPKGLLTLDHDFNGYLLRIKVSGKDNKGNQRTSINIWDKENVRNAEKTHQKEHGFPLDRENSSVILNGDEYSIYRGDWEESKKKKAKKWKVRDFLPLSDSGDSGLGDGADDKWSPVLDAMNVDYINDLVWLGAYFPEIVEEEGKLVDIFDLDSLGYEDPHGDVSIAVFKWKGMLLGQHDDDYSYSGTLCDAKDAVKLAKLLEGDEGIDIGE